MSLEPSEIAEIARQTAALISNPEIAVPLKDAIRRCGFTSAYTFHQWARKVGLRSMKGARGRYSVDAIKSAVERATRQKR